MARLPLTAQAIVKTGLEAVYTDAITDGHSVRDNGHRVLHVKNTDGSDHTVTLPTPGTVDGLAIADRAILVTAGEDRFIALSSRYLQPDGSMNVDYSAITGMKIALLELPV